MHERLGAPNVPAMPKDVAIPLVWLLDLLCILLVARVVVSWIARDDANRFTATLSQLTEPFLRPLRTFLVFGGLDLSPLVLIMAAQLAQQLLLRAAGG